MTEINTLFSSILNQAMQNSAKMPSWLSMPATVNFIDSIELFIINSLKVKFCNYALLSGKQIFEFSTDKLKKNNNPDELIKNMTLLYLKQDKYPVKIYYNEESLLILKHTILKEHPNIDIVTYSNEFLSKAENLFLQEQGK